MNLIRHSTSAFQLRRLTLASVLGLGSSAIAQSVVTPPPSVSVTPPMMMESSPSPMQVFSTENPLASFPDEQQPLQLGPVTFRPHVYYQFLYGTGIQSSPGQEQNTIIQSLAPGLLMVLTPRWTLDYTPTFTFYSDRNFQNNVGQSVTLTGGAAYEQWIFGLSQNFNYSSSPQAQTGGQTSQQTWSTALTASAPLNSKLSVDLGLDQSLNFPSGFQSTREWSTMDWLNYEFWPRFSAGVGAGLGFVAADPDYLFEQAQARVGWRATDKISFQVSGGGQFSQVTDDSSNPINEPIVDATIQYQPFDYTKLSADVKREVAPAYYDNQLSTITTVSGGLQQRLLGALYLNVNGGYNWNTYTALASGVTANSAADYYSVNVQLGTTFFKQLAATVFYTYSANTTTQAGLSFVSNQVGFNLGWRY